MGWQTVCTNHGSGCRVSHKFHRRNEVDDHHNQNGLQVKRHPIGKWPGNGKPRGFHNATKRHIAQQEGQHITCRQAHKEADGPPKALPKQMGNEADCHGQNGQQPVLPCAVASPYGCTSSRRHVRAGRRQGQCNGHYQGTRDRTAEEPAKKARPKASHQHIDNPSRNHATEEGIIPILCRDRHKRGDGHKGRPQ